MASSPNRLSCSGSLLEEPAPKISNEILGRVRESSTRVSVLREAGMPPARFVRGRLPGFGITKPVPLQARTQNRIHMFAGFQALSDVRRGPTDIQR
jgi:hypothetical protein